MGHQNTSSLSSKHSAKGSLLPISAGTGAAHLAPPWSREQVTWRGKGYFVLRLALEGSSRWLLGAGAPWPMVFPHERTFRRSAADKSEVLSSLKMNPWPVHMTCGLDPKTWNTALSARVLPKDVVFDTGHVTLWKLSELPAQLSAMGELVVLDGHHSRRAQHHIGWRHVFGWIEPMDSEHLAVKSIHRAGWLSAWLKELLEKGELRIVEQEGPRVFEVIQAQTRSLCEVKKLGPDETVVDALGRLAKGRAFLRTSANLEELLGWLEAMEVDTVLRLECPTKAQVKARALSRKLFPQKSTCFYPKIPFGLLVEDLLRR